MVHIEHIEDRVDGIDGVDGIWNECKLGRKMAAIL